MFEKHSNNKLSTQISLDNYIFFLLQPKNYKQQLSEDSCKDLISDIDISPDAHVLDLRVNEKQSDRLDTESSASATA